MLVYSFVCLFRCIMCFSSRMFYYEYFSMYLFLIISKLYFFINIPQYSVSWYILILRPSLFHSVKVHNCIFQRISWLDFLYLDLELFFTLWCHILSLNFIICFYNFARSLVAFIFFLLFFIGYVAISCFRRRKSLQPKLGEKMRDFLNHWS